MAGDKRTRGQVLKYIIGVDLGGTKIHTIAINYDGKILSRIELPTCPERGTDFVIRQIVKSVNHVSKRICKSEIAGLGIGTPGAINSKKGIVHFAPNLHWRNVSLKKRLEKYFSFPIFVDNDANLAAYGEQWLGSAKNVKNLIYVAMGTGVGGGLIFDGKIYRGVDDTAGEIGHVTVVPEGLPCGCGNRGCLETYSSGPGIANLAKDKIRKGYPSIIPKMVNNRLEKITSLVVYQAAKRKDKLALEIFRTAGTYLGIILAGLVNLLNVEMIIFTGKVAKAGNLIFNSVRKEIKQRALAVPAKRVRVVCGVLGQDAVALGACRLVKENV